MDNEDLWEPDDYGLQDDLETHDFDEDDAACDGQRTSDAAARQAALQQVVQQRMRDTSATAADAYDADEELHDLMLRDELEDD